MHFLDAKQTVRQTDWGHEYARACDACSLRTICGGLFDRGNAYDPNELHPVFVDRDVVVERIIHDPNDPSYEFRSLEAWRGDFARRLAEARVQGDGPSRRTHDTPPPEMTPSGAPTVGMITEQGLRLFEAKRLTEGRKATRLGVALEKVSTAISHPPDKDR